jgi:hypothetical protein
MRELLAVLVAVLVEVFRMSVGVTIGLSAIVLPRAVGRWIERRRGEADV